MAVEKDRIKARLRALFPKANLSKTRLDAIAAKLSPKPEDDADDTAIDALLTDYNNDSAMTFEELAKYDDKIRTLEAKGNQQQQSTETATGGENTSDKSQSNTQQQPEAVPEWAKPMIQGYQQLMAEKHQQAIQQQVKDKLKDVDPDYYKHAKLPESVDEVDAFADGIKTDYNAFTQRIINSSIGDGRTQRGSAGGKKEASDDEVKSLLDTIM